MTGGVCIGSNAEENRELIEREEMNKVGMEAIRE